MAQVERGVSMGTAIGIVAVVLAAVVTAGIYVGNRYFWKPVETRNLVEKTYDDFETLYEKAPKSKDAKLGYAIVMHQQGRDKVAEKLFKELEKDLPKDPRLLVNMAIFYKDIKKVDLAEQYFEKVLDISPFYFLGNVQYGILLREKGEYDEAIAKFDAALKFDAGAADVILEKAKVYIAENDKENAEKSLNRVLQFLPDNQEAKKLLAELE